MEKAELKKLVCEIIDTRADKIIDIGNYLLANPELGFKEQKGSTRVARELEKLGLDTQRKLGITGVKSVIHGKPDGPTVAVMGELDALVCPSHPDADPVTGAAHVCGHNAQVATMLGVAIGLVEANALKWLGGNVALIAVPAEEYIEIDFKSRLQESGEIEFLGGKQELIQKGAFDDIDIAMMVHAEPNEPRRTFTIGGSSNGFLAKKVKFQGKASHAAARPELGINALNAATLAIMGIHSQRETLRDEDAVRIHFVLTSGGDVVNIVPEDVRMEIFVRGKTIESIEDANRKVNRALEGGASIVGANVEWSDFPGYLPLIEEQCVNLYLQANAKELLEDHNVISGGHRSWSTDAGDLSHLIPVLHPYVGGFSGEIHSDEFHIVDEEMVYVIPTKILAMTIIDLLFDDGKLAKEAIDNYHPKLTKAEYLSYLRARG